MSSEVAQTRQRIEAEARAAWAALYGLCQGSAEHRVIEARMSGIIEKIFEEVGLEAGCEMITSFDRPIQKDNGSAS